MNRLSPNARYQRDVQFRALVDMLEAQCHAANYTPTELREAVMLAAFNFECRRAVRPIRIVAGEILEEGPLPNSPPNAVLVDGVLYRRSEAA